VIYASDKMTIKLVPHRITSDKDNYIVELLRTGEFYEMPRPAIEAIEALVKGVPPEQIESDLTNKYPDEEINMVDFLSQLEDMGFLVNGEDNFSYIGNELDQNKDSEFVVIGLRFGRFLFRKQVIPVYALLFCVNIVFFMGRPDLFPHPRDLFPFNSMVLNIIASLFVSITLLAIHESGHVVAARTYGLASSVRLGHRLLLPVIETQMPTIWRLPRGRRNIPLLAGLFMDHTLLFMSLSVLIFVPSLSVTVTGILGIIVLQLVLMSLYQCMFFMKTDLYYLLQNAFGSYNLLENAEGWLTEKLPFIQRQKTTVIYEKERNIVRGYAMFYILGLLFSAVVFVFYVIPQFMYSFAISFDRLMNPSPTSMKADAVIFFAQFIVYVGVLMYSWWKKFISA
jgi:putative peptide zinc metalloprotease protein